METRLEFRYRYVNFGTSFRLAPGSRSADDADSYPDRLCENELAVDVGGVCWGCAGELLPVLDHHLPREGQFPSASAAVLHKAHLLQEKFNRATQSVVWLVTHKQPDFDAFCSMYLARVIIEQKIEADWRRYGLHSDGWLDPTEPGVLSKRIDWFEPDLTGLAPQSRWPLLLASYASRIDNGRRIACPKHRALHSVLYAALQRGRDYSDKLSGAVEFFDEVKAVLESKRLNPLFDSVLERSAEFAPELTLLDGEVEAYRQDVQRARKAIVYLQKSTGEFDRFFAPLRGACLLNADLSTRPEHLTPPLQTRTQADGIYIRDPRCLLFKEWARTDTEHSSMGRGFTFTGVAYTGGRTSLVNTSDYFFAIDPENADGRHLYSTWARLQSAEIRSLHEQRNLQLLGTLQDAENRAAETSQRTLCRPGFEDRACEFKAFFNDPWFDGSNYKGTIVATPNRGTLIGPPGTRGDLMDDPVVAIIREDLEYSIYAQEDGSRPPQIFVADLAGSPGMADKQPQTWPVMQAAQIAPPALGYYRFARIHLDSAVDVHSRHVGQQLGEALWLVLNGGPQGSDSSDLFHDHLTSSQEWLGLWSRRGIVVAGKPPAVPRLAAIEHEFRELIALTRQVEAFAKPITQDLEVAIKTGEELTRDAARIAHMLALPESRLLSRFFDALRLDEVVRTIRDLNLTASERQRRAGLDEQSRQLTKSTAIVAKVQLKVEWLEIFIVGFYATELAHMIVEVMEIKSHFIALLVIGGSGLLATAITFLLLMTPWRHDNH